MSGWIKLHRKLLENPVVCKDADHLAIWMYLLLNATHTNYDSIFKGKRITLIPGQLITGRKSISSVLKISESKVQRVLKTFKNEQQIEQQTSSQNRLITILNWTTYQESEQRIEQRVNNERTTSEQRVNTNKNDKKDKKDKNIDLVVEAYKEKLLLLPQPRTITDKRKGNVNGRITEYGLDTVMDVIDRISKTDFLLGVNDSKWKADFDWIFNPTNFSKILEGKYDSKSKKGLHTGPIGVPPSESELGERMDGW